MSRRRGGCVRLVNSEVGIGPHEIVGVRDASRKRASQMGESRCDSDLQNPAELFALRIVRFALPLGSAHGGNMQDQVRRRTIARYAMALSQVAEQRVLMASYGATGAGRRDEIAKLVELLQKAFTARLACYALADNDELVHDSHRNS